MTLLPWLLFFHILSAIVWLGGGVVLMLIGAYARSTSDPGPTTVFARVLPFVGLRALTPAVVVLLLSGVSMIFAGAGSFAFFWVQLALGLFLIAFLVGAIYMSRTAIQLDRTVANGGDIQKARGLIDRWLGGYGTILVVLLVALWDMVFKPTL